MRFHPRFRAASVAALATLVTALPAALAKNYGRVTAPHEVVVAEVTPSNDVDDYVFDGAPGWQVKAAVKKAKTGDLAPVLELVAPDGSVEASGTLSSKASAIKKAFLAEEGRYALRVRGASGSGGYSLKWALKPDKGLKVKKDPLGANVNRLYEFAGSGGALVTWALKFKGDGGAQVLRILDPDGVEVPFNENVVQRSLTSEKAKDIPLSGPGGMYALEVRNEFAPVELDLTVKVKLVKAKKTTVTLPAAEPLLSLVNPSTGGCLTQVTLTGTNLGTSPGSLLLGGVPVTGAQVSGGSSVTFTAPGGTGTVDIVYADKDGQVTVLPNAFTYLPKHTVTGIDPTGGPGGGGQLLTITGTNFRTGVSGLYEVRVGGTPASQVKVLDANTITCVTPAHVSGASAVELRDACGATATASQTYNYGLPPFINLVNPSSSPTFGGIEVIIAGFNLSADDKVYLDGVLQESVPYVYDGAIIGHIIPSLPAHAIGYVDLDIVNTSNQTASRADAIAYYEFADVTSTTIPAVTGGDDWGGVSLAQADMDGNGTKDHLLVTHTDRLSATRPGIRALKINGSGVYSDVTATALPAATATQPYGGVRVLAGRMNSAAGDDVYLARPGTGDEAVHASDSRSVVGWARLFFSDGSSSLGVQPHTGPTSALNIAGLLMCNATWACAGKTRPGVCYVFDYDFRSVSAAMGDLDGDGDQDVVLVNDRSINRFVGTSVGTWVSCEGNGVVDYQYYTLYGYGHAVRILSTGSNGGMNDRTKELIEDESKPDEDLRGTAVTIGDISGDGLRDVVFTKNSTHIVNGTQVSATRILRQKNSGSSVSFALLKGAFPAVSGGEDWRADAVVVADLNNDLKPDLVLSYNGAPPGSSGFSTRILMGDAAGGSLKLTDRTSAVMTGVLPAGDDGRAGVLIVRDIDQDGDQDILLATTLSTGTGNRKLRYLLNRGADPETGDPRFLDASAVLPAAAVDDGHAVDVLVSDVTGDGITDIAVLDTFDAGNSGRRLRVFKQAR